MISVSDLINCSTTLDKLTRMKQKPVTLAEIQTLRKRYQVPYFETSAHTGFGVKECFYEAVSMLKKALPYLYFDILRPESSKCKCKKRLKLLKV